MEWWWLGTREDDCAAGSASIPTQPTPTPLAPPPPHTGPVPSAPLEPEQGGDVLPEELTCSVCLCTLETNQDAMRCVGEGGECTCHLSHARVTLRRRFPLLTPARP